MFVELRKIHYNVMRRVRDINEADILAGRAKSVSAKHYAMYELDKMTEACKEAWQRFGVNTDEAGECLARHSNNPH